MPALQHLSEYPQNHLAKQRSILVKAGKTPFTRGNQTLFVKIPERPIKMLKTGIWHSEGVGGMIATL